MDGWMDIVDGWMDVVNVDGWIETIVFPIGFQSTSMISSVFCFLLPTTNNPLALTLCTAQSYMHFSYLVTHQLLYQLYIHMRTYPLTRQVTQVKPNINLIGVFHPQLSHNSLFPMDGWMDAPNGWMWTYYTHSTLPKIKFRSPLRNFLHARFLKGDRKEPVG
jgi:hypothetical protein